MRKANNTFEDYIDQKKTILTTNTSTERYTFIPSGHANKPDIIIGDPCFENPCSYEALEKVFDYILSKTEVGEGRSWTIVGCDGLPYTLGCRTIDSVCRCRECEMEFTSVEEFEKHKILFDHEKCSNINGCLKYLDIIMVPGLGHFEMNMLKAAFRLLWDVILVDLAVILGFHSPKALASCMTATDHHKSWQIFQIFLHAMAEELLLLYAREELKRNERPTGEGFYKWTKHVKNPNYKFMVDAVFTLCLSLHVFRAGVRRNNTSAIRTALFKFAPLFFGFSMPFYIETFIRDSFFRIQCPPEIRNFIENNESFSISGNCSKGEGGDFILESKNRKTKMWMPGGLPDEKTWLPVCRNIDRLEKVRDNMVCELGITENDVDYQYAYDITTEIFEFRKKNTQFLLFKWHRRHQTTCLNVWKATRQGAYRFLQVFTM
ncbi:uncharacterized protein LOC134255654 [Saccostrea cucullata]|uniref:uncharacterized protein LOC134255654 n=1 Tax=Saccostrea cuccullata TaxID=36930 RepID=UPI002ED4E0C3